LNKGVIFTTDAVIALGIFLASLLIFYSFFITEPPFGLRGAGIYTKTDNYMYVEEIYEAFSSVINLYQQGDNATAYFLFETIRTQAEYPANMRLYLLEVNGTVSKVYDSSPNTFSDKLIFRRHTVYSITRGMPSSGTDVFVSAPTTTVNKTTNVSVKVHNPGGASINNVPVSLQIYNFTNNLKSWTVSPPSQTIPTIAAGANATVYFSVTIPIDAWIDEYYAKAVVGAPLTQNGTDPFNVARFGLIEMEVGI